MSAIEGAALSRGGAARRGAAVAGSTSTRCRSPCSAPTASTRPTTAGRRSCSTRARGSPTRPGALSSKATSDAYVAHLRRDLEDGTWDAKCGHLRTQSTYEGALSSSSRAVRVYQRPLSPKHRHGSSRRAQGNRRRPWPPRGLPHSPCQCRQRIPSPDRRASAAGRRLRDRRPASGSGICWTAISTSPVGRNLPLRPPAGGKMFLALISAAMPTCSITLAKWMPLAPPASRIGSRDRPGRQQRAAFNSSPFEVIRMQARRP